MNKVYENYLHIDNGGHSIEVDEHGNITISTSFFGYSSTELYLGNCSKEEELIDFMINSLIEAKGKVKAFRVEHNLNER